MFARITLIFGFIMAPIFTAATVIAMILTIKSIIYDYRREKYPYPNKNWQIINGKITWVGTNTKKKKIK